MTAAPSRRLQSSAVVSETLAALFAQANRASAAEEVDQQLRKALARYQEIWSVCYFFVPDLGERMDDPISMYLSDILTIPCNLAGLPGISQTCGTTSSGLPIGLQFLGKPFGETTVLRAAAAFEEATDHHHALPPL